MVWGHDLCDSEYWTSRDLAGFVEPRLTLNQTFDGDRYSWSKKATLAVCDCQF